MANRSTNTTNAIRQQLYGTIVQETLKDSFFGMDPLFDISEFVDGDTYNMPTVGQMIARTANVGSVEDADVVFDALDTGRITLTIDTYDHIAWYETKKLKEDQYLDLVGVHALQESMFAMKAQFESNMWSKFNGIQTTANVNAVNSAAHRFCATGTNQVVTLADFAYVKFALDKSLVPDMGRIGVVDPAVALTLDKLAGAQGFNYNPMFEGMVTEGFRKDHRFIRNLYGIDLYVSNRLPAISSEAIDASSYGVGSGSITVTGGVANLFFSVASDAVKPVMGAWRRRPELESWEDKEKLDSRINYKITARYGMAKHREQGLVVLLSDTVG